LRRSSRQIVGIYSHSLKDGKIRLCISPIAGPPCAEQVAAYEYLLANSESVYASRLKAVFDVYTSLRDEYREGYGYSEDMDDEEKEEFEEEYGEWVPALLQLPKC